RLEGTSTRFRIPGNAPYRLAYTETASNEPRLYVFNKGNDGFVIASADDSFPALLGYSDNGAFNPSDASPELMWWLGQYAGEASFYLQNPVEGNGAGSGRSISRVNRANIPVLLTTRWNQDSPYNLDCPVDGNMRSVTGCVATAMAQVIKYHAYPVQGVGQHSYSWNGQTLSFNYGSTTFDYADMLDVYDDRATPSQQEAVAALMYACGVGVNMSYSSNESGASDMYIPYALKTFFNYDNGVRLLMRKCFAAEEWENMVYEELAANRPVIYGGQAPTGGHQFVCDGYEDGYFHINWGWAGLGDGYFLLSNLDPGQEGIGGFAGGYNSDQAMVCGAKPDQGGDSWYPIYATGDLQTDGAYNGNTEVKLAFKNGGMYNYSPEGADLSFYLKFVSKREASISLM
ncbi:MAG: C10 family peptidase, partial [Muribaculaceae bacterium]|nr:C10 family peptidase [Muribaculaceae bacterium]